MNISNSDIENLRLAIKRKIEESEVKESKGEGKKLTYRTIYKQTGVPSGTLHHFLTGKTRMPTLENYMRLRNWLGKAVEVGNAGILEIGGDSFRIDGEITSNGISLPFFNDLPAIGGTSSDVPDNPPEQLNLYMRLIERPSKTFIVRVSGDSMTGEAIHPDDLLVVEQIESFEDVRNGDIVVAYVAGNLCVKKCVKSGYKIALRSSPPRKNDKKLTPKPEDKLWGRVLYSIHKH